MNILNYYHRSRVNTLIFSTVQRACTICYRSSVIHNKSTLLSVDQSPMQFVSNRFFMKKIGLKPMYDIYNKKAAKDNISPTEYALIYNGTGEKYVRSLSGIVIVAMIIVPTVLIGTYIYILFTRGQIDLRTYLNILFIPNSILETAIMLFILFSMKLVSYSFISKYVLRIYKHNTKSQYIGVFINPFLPWKNITCTFEKGIKLPNGKIFIVPWYKEYYKIAGNKSIILKDRFRRPIDYDRMLGIDKAWD